MKREIAVSNLDQTDAPWDIIIIGGGATGLGAAVDASSRGYRTLLLEQSDFAAATSSRSTKLIHGGLRYLQQGNISLVTEALHERGRLTTNAPHLIHHLPFFIPSYQWWESPFYGTGLKVYDLLAGKLGIEKSKSLNREETLRIMPTLEPKELRGGVIYYDGQFDDARLAITLACTAVDHGATLINYMPVTELIKKKGTITGVKAKDLESNRTYTLHAHAVINATGIFTDQIRQMDHKNTQEIIAPSQGIHIILPKSFQPSKKAILIPHTEDNRVIFMIPWHDKVLIGTTDTAIKKVSLEPKPHAEEIEFLLNHAAKYLTKNPKKSDILSVFTGIRPLVRAHKGGKATAELARDHVVISDPSKLITIAGGKWTTYRKMAEDAIDQTIKTCALPKRKCLTTELKLHGYKKCDPLAHLSAYGSDIDHIKKLMTKEKSLAKKIHPKLPYLWAELAWAIDQEMARTVEDLLSRRTRSLLLNAHATIEITEKVAKFLAKRRSMPLKWEQEQVKAFKKLAQNYLPEEVK